MKDEKLTAKERADQYRQDDKGTEAARHKKTGARSEEEWANLVDQQIAEAMRKGAFENLPGKGKPLTLGRNSMVPEDQQMAFNLLRNNDLAPSWIGDRKEIQARTERIYKQIESNYRWQCEQWAKGSDEAESLRLQKAWDRQLERWESEIKELNRRILTHNLQQPIAHLEIVQVHLDEALSRAGAKRDLTN